MEIMFINKNALHKKLTKIYNKKGNEVLLMGAF
jgi:hypothetical protein